MGMGKQTSVHAGIGVGTLVYTRMGPGVGGIARALVGALLSVYTCTWRNEYCHRCRLLSGATDTGCGITAVPGNIVVACCGLPLDIDTRSTGVVNTVLIATGRSTIRATVQ